MLLKLALMSVMMILGPALCLTDRPEGRNAPETDQLLPALEETILQAKRKDSLLRSDQQGEVSGRGGLWAEPESARLVG